MSQLPTVLPAPPATAARGATDLLELVEWCRAHDSRMGYFAALYTHVEAAIAKALARDEFVHPDLLRRVNGAFLDRYVDAAGAHRAGKRVTAPWAVAFDAAASDRLCVLQHLLLGMNAHINFDLPAAIDDVLDRDEVMVFRADYDHMNEVLASVVDDVANDLARAWPLLRWINRIGRSPEDVIIEFSMRVARDHAWGGAIALSRLSGSARERGVAALSDEAVDVADAVAHPRFPASWIASFIRFGERGSVADIIDDLLS